MASRSPFGEKAIAFDAFRDADEPRDELQILRGIEKHSW